MYHDIGKMWRLKFHTLYYKCCTQLQKHIFRQMGKPHKTIHVRVHLIGFYLNDCFHTTLLTLTTRWGIPSAFDHIQLCFPHIFKQTQSLHEFVSRSQCTHSYRHVCTNFNYEEDLYLWGLAWIFMIFESHYYSFIHVCLINIRFCMIVGTCKNFLMHFWCP